MVKTFAGTLKTLLFGKKETYSAESFKSLCITVTDILIFIPSENLLTFTKAKIRPKDRAIVCPKEGTQAIEIDRQRSLPCLLKIPFLAASFCPSAIFINVIAQRIILRSILFRPWWCRLDTLSSFFRDASRMELAGISRREQQGIHI